MIKVWQEHKSLVLGRNNNHRFLSVPHKIAQKTLIVTLYTLGTCLGLLLIPNKCKNTMNMAMTIDIRYP